MSTKQAVIQHELMIERGDEPGYIVDPHVYDGERCVNCNVNVYDDGIYGPFPCVPHEPMRYSTQTGDPSVFDHDPARYEVDARNAR